MKHLYILSAIISLSVSANIELIINKVQSVLPDGAVVERIEESEISGIYKGFTATSSQYMYLAMEIFLYMETCTLLKMNQ